MNDNRECVGQWVEGILGEVRALRRELHQQPELGYEEHATAARVVAELSKMEGMEVRTGLAGTGVVATLRGDLAGPCVGLRADMDALPIEEKSGVAWASRVPGKMHACGHDGHTAILIGAARVLHRMRDELEGPVRFIFQPAEEGGKGGARMVEDGALENPRVDAVFGLHNMPFEETHVGQLALCEGAAMAGSGLFRIVVRGKGGHAAFPHRCVDPIVVGTHIVQALQAIVSRQVDPIAPAVISVTQFHAGSAFNVIPERAELCGTFRALDAVVLKDLEVSIGARARAVAEAFGASVEADVAINYPVVVNHARTSALFRRVVEELGRGSDLRAVPPMMGSEDFAFYQLERPGTFWFLPSRPVDKPSVPFCHHPEYDFNDDALRDGIRVTVELARRFPRLWRE